MAKKPSKKTTYKEINRNILTQNSTEYLNNASLEYSIYTLSRQITGIDGLKSAQRKGIYAISKVQGKIKTMSLTGKMIEMGIYVHGDASANSTLSALASPVDNNYPLIHGHGSFGTCANPEPAAARYTYVEKSKITNNLILVDTDVMPMQENYDGTTYEPVHFLPLIPVSLLGTTGLSVGYRANILPRKIEDIIDNTINAIRKKPFKEMKPYFASNGCNEFVENHGESKYTVYGKAEILDSSTVRITGLPVNMSLVKFTEMLIDMSDKGLIRDYDDSSTDFIDITVKLPRALATSWSEIDALEYFKLYTKMTEAVIILDENEKVKVYEDINDVFKDYINFRFQYFIKRYNVRLDESIDKLRSTLLLQACFENDIASKIKNFKNRAEMVDFITSLNSEFEADESHIQRFVNFPSYRWTQEYREELEKDLIKIGNDIEYYEDLLANHNKIWDIYVQELEDLKTKF